MPVNIIGSFIEQGKDAIPYYDQVVQYAPFVAGIGALKWYFSGATNTWERNLHGKVIVMTVSSRQRSDNIYLILCRAEPPEWVRLLLNSLLEKELNLYFL